jgi:hypothetical protein
MTQRGLGWRAIRILIAAGLAIVTLAPGAVARDLTPGARGVIEAGPVILVQGEGTRTGTAAPCKLSGCSREICSDHDVFTPYIWRPEFSCYKQALCEIQADGKCGWIMTAELKACLSTKRSLTGKSSRGFASPPN